MILASTPKAQREKKFPYSKLQREAEPYGDVNQNPPSVLLRAEITEAKSLWPSIKAMIEDCIESKQSYIIEGVALMPDLVELLKKELYWHEIRLVYLAKNDLEEILDGFARNTSSHDWLSGAKDNPELLRRVARMVQVKSEYITNLANKVGFTVVDTGVDFEKKIERLVQKILVDTFQIR